MERETDIYNTNYSSTSSSKQGDYKKVLFGALAGAAIGSLVGSLYTGKGIETRNRLSDRSRKMANNIKEKTADITEGIKEKVSDVTAPIADKYRSTKKVATKLFAKEKPEGSISQLHGANDNYVSEDVEISKTKVISALLAAALAGTVIWSFTSEKGKETRKRAVKKTQEVAGKLKVQATKLAEGAKKGIEVAKEGVDDLLERQRQQQQYATTSANAYNSSPNPVNTTTL